MALIIDDIRRSPIPLTYEGDLEVLGTIRSGVKMEVAGNLKVYGNVEDAWIDTNGNVWIDGGFLGTGNGVIRCEGSFSSRFIQNQRVVAKADVEVRSGMLSAAVFCSGSVLVRESIVGGRIHAYKRIEASVLGSIRPVMTFLEVGVDPIISLEIENLEEQAMALTRRRLECIKNLEAISRNESKDCDDKKADLEATASAILADVILIAQRIVTLRQKARLNYDSEIIVYDRCLPPTEIRICFASKCFEQELGTSRLFLSNDSICREPLRNWRKNG
ncbi:MAG: FapA family protein [bacterium]